MRIAELEAELRVLREQDARTPLILDSATDYASIILDDSGRVTSWNVGAQSIMGYAEARSSAVGRLHVHCRGSQPRQVAAELRRATRQGVPATSAGTCVDDAAFEYTVTS